MPRKAGMPYLQEFCDATGVIRRYVRRRGQPLIAINGKRGTRKFLEQYKAAVGGFDLPQQEEATGVVYFADDGQFIKIGFTKNTKGRASQLQTGSSRNVHIIATRSGTMQDERKLHRQFAHLRHRGEWFRKERELLAYIGLEATNSWSDA